VLAGLGDVSLLGVEPLILVQGPFELLGEMLGRLTALDQADAERSGSHG
jgi:hypothetical protein